MSRRNSRFSSRVNEIVASVHAGRRCIRPRPAGLPIGQDTDSGERVLLPGPADAAHTLVFGSTGSGKSFATELAVCKLLWFRRVCPARCPSVVVIDPHGSLAERVVKRCVQFGLPASDVVIIDLGDPISLPAWQPLARGSASVAYQTSAIATAIGKCSGQFDFDTTQQLRRWLRNIFWPLLEANCSLAELEAMLSVDAETPLRDAIVGHCTNRAVCAAWEQEFKRLNTVTQRLERAIGSSLNRLASFYMHPHLRRLFGQTEEVIDWRDVMDSGKVVVVNLHGGVQVADDDCRLVGSLFINDLVAAAKRPPARSGQRACYVVADEFQRVCNLDFMALLRECRKFRVFAWLATQDPSALRLFDEELYLSALSNTGAKLLFGGIDCRELEPLVRNGFAAVLDADAVKFDLERTYFAPHESTREVHGYVAGESLIRGKTAGVNESESWSEADISAWADSTLSSQSTGNSTSTSFIDGMFLPEATGVSTVGSSGGLLNAASSSASGGHVSARASGISHMHATTEAQGVHSQHSVSQVPFYELKERHELSSRQFRTLEEQIQIAINRVHCLQRQHALVVETGRPPHLIKVWHVPEPPVSDAIAARFRAAVFSRYRTPEQIDAAIEARQRSLLAELQPAAHRLRIVPARTRPSTAPAAVLAAELDHLVWGDEAELHRYLQRLAGLPAAARHPLLDQLSFRSGRPRSFYVQQMRNSNGNGRH